MKNEENNLLNNQPVNNNSEIFNVPPTDDGMNLEQQHAETINEINQEIQSMSPVNTDTMQEMSEFDAVQSQMTTQIPNIGLMTNNTLNSNISNIEPNNDETNQKIQNVQSWQTEIENDVPNVPFVNPEPNLEVKDIESMNHESSQNITTVSPLVSGSEPVVETPKAMKNNNKYVPLLAIGAIIIFILIAYFTLFNTKTLECTLTGSETGMSMKQTMKVTFRKNSITQLGMATTVTLDEDYKDYIDFFKNAFEEEFEAKFGDYKDKLGVTMDTKTKDNVFTFKLEADLTKMDEETKESLNMTGNSETYKEVKASLEEDGYTCK